MTYEGQYYYGECTVDVTVITPSVTLDKDSIVVDETSVTLEATTAPPTAEVTWTKTSTGMGEFTITPDQDDDHICVASSPEFECAGTITATITVNGVDYSATCNVVSSVNI